MKYPDPAYKRTENDDYLELHSYDGTYRGVMFIDAAAAADACRPGRAELDCGAVNRGFLPRGATLVSSPGVVDEVFGGDTEALRTAKARAAVAGFVTRESDTEARRRSPRAAARYDAMTEPSPTSIGWLN